ncbi:MAG: transcription termination factor Rho [bacterium JZ-2024 1]
MENHRYTAEELESKKVGDIYRIAKELGIETPHRMRKTELISRILQATTRGAEDQVVEGILDILDSNYGFLRTFGYLGSQHDVYVPPGMIKSYGLRPGDRIRGVPAPRNDKDKRPSLKEIMLVNGKDPQTARLRPVFDDLIPIYPNERLRLEADPEDATTRLIDIVAPIGKGQRALIISPPKAGKTTILKKIARSIAMNYPEIHLIALLVDERPEEVTDFERSVDGEVVSSTFDEKPDNHAKVAEMVLNRAKRIAESGEDVVILLDSLTRLGRAYNLIVPSSGRTLSGGLDPTSLYKPKRFFGAARNIEGGGSLTIIATCLVDTGSRLDEIIYEEFKGTGNLEVHLDRNIANRRIFPAIDVLKSGTRHEELLFTPEELERVWRLRRILATLTPLEALEVLLSGLSKTKTNAEFLQSEELRRGLVSQPVF